MKLILFLFIGLFSLNSFSQEKAIEATRLNTMKNLWTLLSENNRMRVYLSSACENYELNKWPVFVNRKIVFTGDAQLEEKVYNDFTKLCSKTISEDQLATYYVYEGFNLDDEETLIAIDSSILEMSKKLSVDYQLRGQLRPIKELLTVDEFNSLKNYTDKSSLSYNTCMRDNSKCPSEAKWGIDKIKSAIFKINNASKDSKKGIYFRGAHSLPESVLKNIKFGVETKTPIILDAAFLSTSGKAAISKRFAGHFSSRDVDGVIFVIKSRNCAGIASLSEWDTEDEFLCPANMKFIIKDTGLKIPVDPGIGGLRPGELPHSPSKVYYLEEV